MKKILVALAAMAVVFSLAGCGKDEKKDTPTESATSLSDPAAGGTESNEDYGDISSNVKKEIDDYEALCSEYYTLLTENIGADEDRRQEVILDLYDLRYDSGNQQQCRRTMGKSRTFRADGWRKTAVQMKHTTQ